MRSLLGTGLVETRTCRTIGYGLNLLLLSMSITSHFSTCCTCLHVSTIYRGHQKRSAT